MAKAEATGKKLVGMIVCGELLQKQKIRASQAHPVGRGEAVLSGLQFATRFLSGATRLAIKRL